MKRIKLIFTIALCIFFITSIRAQVIQRMIVHKDGGILYSAILTASDSIIFTIRPPDIEEGIEINGVTWAKSNVNAPGTFAKYPYETGMFYQWNRPIGWSSTDPMENHQGGTTWDSSPPEGDSWTNNVCPKGWRVPTRNECMSLITSTSTWGELNDISGRFFGDDDEKLFLPAPGVRMFSNGALNLPNFGYYWSSNRHSDPYAYYMYFNNGNFSVDPQSPAFGFTIRCVLE